ncbi:hypothetical protein PV10_05188 [Exophiala mesophila]|uniref:Transcription and mRNA export factor SUS1 n=1 Tax=Exophiala mesophila TaxID=212818 RepID=A0A0D1Y0N3_EXOME|nr:uncharacterized protein PV10_05188 [Exophiala mesophila]KIV94026.1 hypothetical protein PV10_05188 [Exophiala mesophila]
MANDSAITIPLPTSLTSTSTTLPPATSQALIAQLRNTNSVADLSTLLADQLARSGWTDRVRALSLELLRNGTCDTFPELMTEVMRRAKLGAQKGGQLETSKDKDGKDGKDSKDKSKANGTSTPTSAAAAAAAAVNGNQAIAVSKEWSGGPDGLPDVRIPEVVVQQAVELLKERIKDVVVPVDDDSD